MGYLYSKTQDMYYNPSKASLIEFGVKAGESWLKGVEEDQPYATLTGAEFYRITDPDAIEELRRWCEQHSESW